MAGISISALTRPGFVPMSLTHRLFSRCARPLRFATRNCHSLSSNIKLEQLGLDFERYKLDFLALQETRREADPRPTRMGQCGATLHTLRGGMAFIVGHRLQPYLQSSKSIRDRVAVVTFHFGKQDIPISAVIAYGPTTPRCTADPKLRENFFQQLQAAVAPIPRRAVTLLMGDMNAKIGKRSNDDTYSCLGSWSKGKRNENGEAFLNFCERSNLIITNSLFKHASRHITTWQGYHRSSDSTESTPIYNQIDYIAISN